MPAPALPKLGALDVSLLLPVPTKKSELDLGLPLSALVSHVGGVAGPRIWNDEDFGAFIAIASKAPGNTVATSGRSILIPQELRAITQWFVAGIRIDNAAPGGSAAIIAAMGQQPQIRLIAQPVTVDAQGKVTVQDVTAHLIFSFAKPVPLPPAEAGCFPRAEADPQAFEAVVRAFAGLKTGLAAGKFGGAPIKTDGKPLGVHPGFVGPQAKGFRDAVKGALESTLHPQRLRAMAVMGLNGGGPEPWIFLSMLRLPKGTPVPGIGPLPADSFIPVPAPALNGQDSAQMLAFIDTPQVQPVPKTNNLNPITCRNASLQPPFPDSARKGVSTAQIIDGALPQAEVLKIVDVVANPAQSHFFNTDCVSCHTETQLRFGHSSGPTALTVKPIAGIETAVLPNHNWNLRNFGWFPNFFAGGAARATVTVRTANETAEVVKGVNALIDGLNKAPGGK